MTFIDTITYVEIADDGTTRFIGGSCLAKEELRWE